MPRYLRMPKNNAMAETPATIATLHGKSLFRMGPPPELGKPVTFGKRVAVGGALVGVDVNVAVGVEVGVEVGVDVGVDVGGSETAQVVLVMVLVSRVTAPLRARALPGIMPALVFRVMLVRARIFPWNAVVVPSVAELPICQKTLQPEPLLIIRTDELLAVVRVLPILKTNTELGLPWASSVKAPVNWAEVLKQ